jgi:hypothetical protein
MLPLPDFILITILSISFRWFIFQYKLFAPIRNWLKSRDIPLINELMHCVYCQTIEAAAVIFAVFWMAQTINCHWLIIPVAILAIGFIGVLAEGWIEKRVWEMEELSK